MNAEDTRITKWFSASKWGKTLVRASKRGKMCLDDDDEDAISKKPPLLNAQDKQ